MANIRDTGVQWGASSVQWDGAKFYVHAKVFIEPWPAAWLNSGHLESYLREIFKDDEVTVQIAAAIPYPVGGYVDPQGMRHVGFEQTGEILIGPFEALPEARVLREAVDRQVKEAVSAARAAGEQARSYEDDLRS